MNFFKIVTLRALLALSMLCGAGQALAGPVYQVRIDTASLAGQSGYLDFLMLSLGGAEPVQATITNFAGFSGDPADGSFASGDAGGSVAGAVAIGNGAPWNEFGQWVKFGGVFGFDVSFSTGADVGAGTNLGIALLDAGFGYLGTAADVVTFAVQPGVGIAVWTEAGVASVRILPEGGVPEPSTVLQGLTGLLLMGALARRRGRASMQA